MSYYVRNMKYAFFCILDKQRNDCQMVLVSNQTLNILAVLVWTSQPHLSRGLWSDLIHQRLDLDFDSTNVVSTTTQSHLFRLAFV